MKKPLLNFLKYCGLFLFIMLICNIALYMTSLIDSRLLEGNVRKSSAILNGEEQKHKISEIFDIYSDSYTDAIIINEAYSINNSTPYISYMKIRKNYDKKLTYSELFETNGEGVTSNYIFEHHIEKNIGWAIGELNDFLNGRLHYSPIYGRYWHGYLVFVRPLLLVFDISGIRNFTLFLCVILLLYLTYLLYKEFGKTIAFIFCASLISSGYLSAFYSLSDSATIVFMMICSIVLLKKINKIKDFNIFIFVVGCLTNYIDFLRLPLITLGVPCAIYLLKLKKEEKDWKYCTKALIISSFMWIIAYALTWIFKWVQYDLTIDDLNDMVKIGFNQILYRTERINEMCETYGFCGPTTNYIVIIIKIIGKSLLYTIITMLIVLIINKCNFKFKLNKDIIPFLILSLYPIAWYIGLANHTILHAFFIYRLSVIFMLGVLLGLCQFLKFNKS